MSIHPDGGEGVAWSISIHPDIDEGVAWSMSIQPEGGAGSIVKRNRIVNIHEQIYNYIHTNL